MAIAPLSKLAKAITNVATEPLATRVHQAVRRRESIGIGVKLTIEDRTSEETEELDEQVLLLGGDFVPAVALAALLDFRAGDTLLDVGLEPLVGHGAIGGRATLGLAEPGLLGLLISTLVRLGLGSLGISVGGDVLLQSSVLVWSGVSRVATDGQSRYCNNSPRSSMLPGACDHLRDLSAAPSPPPFSISFSPKLTRGAAILDSDAQVNGRYVRDGKKGEKGVMLFR